MSAPAYAFDGSLAVERLLLGAPQPAPKSPRAPSLMAVAKFEDTDFTYEWDGVACRQRGINQRMAESLRAIPTAIQSKDLSPAYQAEVAALLAHYKDQAEDFAAQVRSNFNVLDLLLSLRVLQAAGPSLPCAPERPWRGLTLSEPLSPEHHSLRSLQRACGAQDALITRMMDGWDNMMQRCQDMCMLRHAPAQVRDPFTTPTRYLPVETAEAATTAVLVGKRAAKVAQTTRVKLLAPLLTELKHMQMRLHHLVDWDPSSSVRGRLEKEQQPMARRRRV